MADGLLAEERWRQVLTSLTVCLFARRLYEPELVQKALAAVGFERSIDELEHPGRNTLRAKNDFKAQEGFDLAQLRLPQHIFETTPPTGALSEALMRRALEHLASKV